MITIPFFVSKAGTHIPGWQSGTFPALVFGFSKIQTFPSFLEFGHTEGKMAGNVGRVAIFIYTVPPF